MNKKLTQDELNEISQYIIKNTGIYYNKEHWSDLERNISAVFQELQMDFSSWSDIISDNRLLKLFTDSLIKHITITETYFFRDKNLFTYLRDTLLPDLIHRRRVEGKHYLRIWSAACSSGEEPYSIALLLRYLIPDYETWDIFLMGTDINQDMINRAIKGEYSRWSFRNEPIVPTGQYFRTKSNNKLQIDESIINMVRFEQSNLIPDSSLHYFIHPEFLDIILCRNLLMYFSPEQSTRVISYLTESLIPKGYLIVSPQEIGIVINPEVSLIRNGSVFIFIKKPRKGPSIFEGFARIQDLTEYTHQMPDEPDIRPINTIPNETICYPINRPPDLPDLNSPSGTDTSVEPPGVCPDPTYEKTTHINLIDTDIENQEKKLEEMEDLVIKFAGRGDYKDAAGWCDRMIAKDPLYPRSYLLKSAVLEEQGFFSDAIISLRQALYANPDYLPAHLAIAGIYRNTGRADEARHHYEVAIHILNSIDDFVILDESEGIAAGKMKELINSILIGG